MSFASRRAVPDAKHVLLRGMPTATTAQDVRRLVLRTGMKGVSEVAMYYRNFRPTGKAILTMALPDYTSGAIRDAEEILLPGSKIAAEVVPDLRGLGILPDERERSNPKYYGTGPFAGVPEGKTVTISGFAGKMSMSQFLPLLKGFSTARDQKHPVQLVPLPERKFSLYSRYIVFLESESEAQRFVRKYHMTRFKKLPQAPLLKAFVIN